MADPLPCDLDDRKRGPVAIVLCAPGHQPYPLRLKRAGLRVTVQHGLLAQHYDLSGVDAAGRLVYRLTGVEPSSPGLHSLWQD